MTVIVIFSFLKYLLLFFILTMFPFIFVEMFLNKNLGRCHVKIVDPTA